MILTCLGISYRSLTGSKTLQLTLLDLLITDRERKKKKEKERRREREREGKKDRLRERETQGERRGEYRRQREREGGEEREEEGKRERRRGTGGVAGTEMDHRCLYLLRGHASQCVPARPFTLRRFKLSEAMVTSQGVSL